MPKFETLPENVVEGEVYAFTPRGKWKYSGRGFVQTDLWRGNNLGRLLELNDGKIPGMSGYDPSLCYAVIPDDECVPFFIPASEDYV